ncbi:N-6 DNA methylase [Marixanthomonas sp. SCSIO 43207]|uniref:type ISP restriction/modification enzyme n=1 Tax=Marixanthomonas sp. SCSIO 43207 TaxID=2779360 RepID=UPI001CA969AA|nr:type ISP restriction/modification enzyme [Marixanthomonas sp. SCSIO 43207]UAB80960.1 N-6 DNA methylase [Marixanthomonas sp. SCSIO 43207]
MIREYIEKVNQRYKLGNATEHTFRGDLQLLIEQINPKISATNEPKRQACGAPDYVITKGQIPVGYIEAKDVGDPDLDGKKKNKRQFNRYKDSLDNLIFTDYLDFHFYNQGELTTTIQLAEIVDGKIVPKTENFEHFTALIVDFTTYIGQSIKSSSKLSKMMAGKARMLAQVIENALNSDEETKQNSSLKEQMLAFKEILIHDITPKEFADIYAQTIAYGMFAARLHDPTPENFSRHEAASLIPKTNPFLRKLFQYISGYDIDERIEWIVSDLADIFRATDVNKMLTNYGEARQSQDPIIHFYEDFLAEYDPKLRKSRGVWYTPEPVVDFIVRAVDDILKTEFDLPNGLADNRKTTVKIKTDIPNKNYKSGYKEVDQEVHKVQILDPATGTGTFLAQVITHIYNNRFKKMQGAWSGYVEKDLIPRLNGFEILMASYAMAHLKLDLLLTETGYKPTIDQRFKVYLTNSLEEYHPDTGTLFSGWLSSEANEANHIKRDSPVMVVMGNPPYSVSSTNKGQWIESLIDDYKRGLKERSYNSLSDDYVKFIRYGQHYIDKNGSGILAYISNNSFIDGLIHRQMRKSLLNTFDKIYIINLHGNSRTQEAIPSNIKDENVFDIRQGVSINIFVKNGNKKGSDLGSVFYKEIYGKREYKYNILRETKIIDFSWIEVKNVKPHYYFKPKNFDNKDIYEEGFLLSNLFLEFNPGVESGRDSLFLDYSSSKLEHKIKDVLNSDLLEREKVYREYKIKDTKSFKLKTELEKAIYDPIKIKRISYSPFDIRYSYYDTNILRRPSYNTFEHILSGSMGLIIKRGFSQSDTPPTFIVNKLSDRRGWTRSGMQGAESIAPLYLYSKENETQDIFKTSDGDIKERVPNLDMDIVKKIEEQLELPFAPEGLLTPPELPKKGETIEKARERLEKEGDPFFTPLDLLDYIYGVLHSPTYRETYKEFLKIDFPRVPYPDDKTTFWQLVRLGGELREIHLLESPKVEEFITSYPEDGDNMVTRKLTKTSIGYEGTTETTGKVWINDQQYFDNVPLKAWEFYIGGYQPAQKWLKDRRDRELSYDDILHYQKIIVALTETDRIMKEIDKIELI